MPKFFHVIFKAFAVTVLLLSAGVATFPQDEAPIDAMAAELANLRSPDEAVRSMAVLFFAQAGNDEWKVEPLISVLNDPDDEIRIMAATALGFLKAPRAIGPLIPLLKDKNTMVQARTAFALGNIGAPEAVEPLLAELAVADLGIQFHIIDALAVLDDPRAVRPLFDLRALNALGKSAVEPMCEILTRGPSSERWYAVSALERIADERAIDSLISVLGVRENAIGQTAADTLARRIGKPAIPALIAVLIDKDPVVRVNAVRALTQHMGDEQARDALVGCAINDSDPSVRRKLFESFGNIANHTWGPVDEHIIATLLVGMRDKNAEIRLTALKGLLRVQRDDVFHALINALSDPATSAEASIAVGNRKDVRALPHLLTVLRGEPFLAARAAQALTSIGEPAIDGLISVLIDKNKEFPFREIRRRQQYAEFPVFRCGNDEPDPILDPRVLAANALGQIGDGRARIPLTKALKDQAEWLRQAAAAALENLDK